MSPTLSDCLRLAAQQIQAAAMCNVSVSSDDMRSLASFLDNAASEAESIERQRQPVPAILPENVVAFRPRSLRAALARLEA